MGPWLGVLIVPAALGGLLGILSIYRRLARPHPELVRKLLHVGMGCVTLSFPWLFDSPTPVVILAAAQRSLCDACCSPPRAATS